MPSDAQLSPHFFLSHFVVSPLLGRCGIRNVPVGYQIDNLKRMALALELVMQYLGGAQVTVLRGFRRVALQQIGVDEAANDGRSVDFIVPAYGTPRQVCEQLMAAGLRRDRLVACPDWVQLDMPAIGQRPRMLVQTGVFELNQPMRHLEGLV